MIWFTADQHFGEKRLAIMGRPFEDVHHQNEFIVAAFNKRVSRNDLVYFVGDVTSNAAPESLDMLLRLVPCRKILLRGNHDKIHSDSRLLEFFDEVHDEGKTVNVDIGELKLALNHYPTRAVPGRFNIVGHIHSAWRVQLNSLNVGVDANHFFPLSETDVRSAIKSIREYYDEDCWAAYSPANISFRGKRGKPGSYYDSSDSQDR